MKKFIVTLTLILICVLFAGCNKTADNTSLKDSGTASGASSDTSSVDPATCDHEWQEATCEKPETCSVCGFESGKPLGHDYYSKFCLTCFKDMPEEEIINLGNVVIMGDSITTFEGYSYELGQFWYPDGGRDDDMTDVVSIDQTWWDKFISNYECKLLRNQSCSGSTFVEARYKDGEFVKAYNSFWDRLNRYMIEENFFEGKTVDTFIFFGGTNDNGACAMGEIMYEGWTDEDLKYFAPAYAHYIYQVKKVCPDAKLVSIVDTTLTTVADTMIEINEHYGVLTVEIDGFDEIDPHPTILGMKQIEKVLREALKKDL